MAVGMTRYQWDLGYYSFKSKMKKYFMKEISIEYHMDKAKQCYILLISNIEERYKRVRQKGGEY